MTAAAAYWHAACSRREHRVHVLFLAGLLLGVMAAASAQSRISILLVCLSRFAGELDGTGLAGLPFRATRLVPQTSRRISPFPYLASLLNLSQKSCRNWLLAIGLLVLALGLCRSTIPNGLLVGGAMLVVSVMAAANAWRARSQVSVYLPACFFRQPAHVLDCLVPSESTMPGMQAILSLGYALLLGLSAASIIWTVVEFIARSETPPVSLRNFGPAFTHVAAWSAACLGVVLVAGSYANQWAYGDTPGNLLLIAAAIVTLGTAFMVFLWDAEAPAPLAGLYVTGLLGVFLGLQSFSLPSERLGWLAALALSGYALLTVPGPALST